MYELNLILIINVLFSHEKSTKSLYKPISTYIATYISVTYKYKKFQNFFAQA